MENIVNPLIEYVNNSDKLSDEIKKIFANAIKIPLQQL